MACKKNEVLLSSEQDKAKQVHAFLREQKNIVSDYQSEKLDTLLQNISVDDIRVIRIGQTELILCDLKTYKNAAVPDFPNTYYKVSFPIENGKITTGLIYTIHTPLSKEEIERDFENILKVKSSVFTGEIVTNSLTDRFIQSSLVKRGRLEKTFELQTGASKRINQPKSIQSLSSNCTAYYLITTTYFSDGRVERDEQYLFTLCGSCDPGGQPSGRTITADCDPNGGSGGGATINTEETENISESLSEVDETFAAAPRIDWNCNATISRINGQVIGVVVDPMTVSNPVAWYVDNYGRSTTRTITLFGHYNSWTSLGSTALINWSCFVHGKWAYTDNSPIYTRQWHKSHSTIR